MRKVMSGNDGMPQIDFTSAFYKNCRSVRNRGGKICQSCPFREEIEKQERDRLIRNNKGASK